MDIIRTLSVLGFLSASLFGQLTIDGQWKPVEPTLQPTVEVVAPFGLELDTTDADIVTWTWDRGVTVWKTSENRLEVNCPKGVYRITWLKRTINFQEGRIDRETGDFVFRVGTASVPDKPDQPDEPDKPTDPVPVPGFSELQELANVAVRKTNDVATAKKIGSFYTSWAASASASRPISTLRYEVRRGLGDVLVEREGDADWETHWRIPASALLSKYTDGAEYIKAIAACGAAFNSSQSQSYKSLENRGTLYFYTSSNPTINCPYCIKWKNEELENFVRAGIKVVERVTSGTVPSFRYVAPDGRQSKTMTGYLPYTTFQKMLEK